MCQRQCHGGLANTRHAVDHAERGSSGAECHGNLCSERVEVAFSSDETWWIAFECIRAQLCFACCWRRPSPTGRNVVSPNDLLIQIAQRALWINTELAVEPSTCRVKLVDRIGTAARGVERAHQIVGDALIEGVATGEF